MSCFKYSFVLAAALVVFAISQSAYSQNLCNLGVPCQSDAQCMDFTASGAPLGGCPECMGCVNGFCEPKDELCDDGNDCTEDICLFDTHLNHNGAGAGIIILPNGCQYHTIAIDFPPPDDLPIQCYICEPTANGVLVDNGICDPAAGENCSNSADCREVGVPCGSPPPPPYDCDPFKTPDKTAPCQDGDRCTDDLCEPSIVPMGIDAQGPPPGTCSNPEKMCNPISDGCCPAGCEGPDPATADPNDEICFTKDAAGAPIPIPNCDADCWFPQVCGDGLVQPPETCDDDANMGDAGISPTGAIVSDEQCRNVGEPAECTYCGDGIIQAAAGEECELGLIGSCGSSGQAGTCDLTTCQCIPEVCVTGSGNPWDTIRPGCGNCSLNKGAIGQGLFKDYRVFLLLAIILGMGWVARRRSS